jgi:hypothetical protein
MPSPRSCGRAVLLVLTLGSVLGLLALAPAAGAYSGTTNGRPGGITFERIQGTHYNSCTHTTAYTCFTPWIVGSGPVVSRSPAFNGTQSVAALYALQVWNGAAWATFGTPRYHTVYVSYAQPSVRFPRVDFLPKRGGQFRVAISVVWSTLGDVTLGGRGALYNHNADYFCNTRFPCSVGSGAVFLRS